MFAALVLSVTSAADTSAEAEGLQPDGGAPNDVPAMVGVAPIGSLDGLSLDAMTLEQILQIDLDVWSATKTKVKVEDAAAIVTVITGAEAREWGYQSVAEVLRHTLGFYVIDDYLIPNVAVRGVSAGLWGESSIIKLMLNGHSLAFRSTAGNWLGPELIPLSAVDRIEIIRGPASALYGADAFLGVINIVTRKHTSLNGMEATVGTSVSNNRWGDQEAVTAGTQLGPVAVVGAFQHHHSNYSGLLLPRSSPAPLLANYRSRGEPASDLVQDSMVGFLQLAVEPRAGLSFRLSGYLSMLERGAEFSPWLQLGNGLDLQGRTVVNKVALAHGHLALDGEWAVGQSVTASIRALYFKGGPTRRDRLDVGSDFYFVTRQFGFEGTEVGVDVRWEARPRLTFIVGADALYHRENLRSVLAVVKTSQGEVAAGDVIRASSTHEGVQTFLNPAAYLLALWTPVEKYLQLTAGARYDHHNVYGTQLSARAGIVSEPISAVRLKVLYGSAFKAPSPLLLYGTPLRSGDIIGNPELKPQRVDTFEASVSWRPVSNLTLQSDVSYSLLTNKTEFTQQGSNQVARNLAELGALSWETRVEGYYSNLLTAYGSFELTQAVRNLGQEGYQAALVSNGNPIYPTMMFHAGVKLSPKSLPIRGNLEVSYIGERRASDANALENGAVYNLPAYGIASAGLGTDAVELFKGHQTRISARVTNLFDARVADPGFAGIDYPVAPRMIFLQLTQSM